MKLLLDTHVLLWWMSSDERLSTQSLQAIRSRDNLIQVSVVTLWEIVIKVRVNKLRVDIRSLQEAIESAGFERLAITARHLAALQTLPAHHKDPFDHLIIAQAIEESATLVSANRAFRDYAVDVFQASR